MSINFIGIALHDLSPLKIVVFVPNIWLVETAFRWIDSIHFNSIILVGVSMCLCINVYVNDTNWICHCNSPKWIIHKNVYLQLDIDFFSFFSSFTFTLHFPFALLCLVHFESVIWVQNTFKGKNKILCYAIASKS